MVLGLLLAIPQEGFVDALFAAAAAGAFFLLIAIVSGGGMGGGDIKLAAMMGASLGWPRIAVALLFAFTPGAAVGLLLIALKRRSRKDPIPFGPALAAGGGDCAPVGTRNHRLVPWPVGAISFATFHRSSCRPFLR